MNKHLKTCPFSEVSEKSLEETQTINDYYSQRISLSLESDENSVQVSIPSFDSGNSNLRNIRTRLLETLKKINLSTSTLSTLDYYRVKIKEKVQDQQGLYKKSEEVSDLNLLEIGQKLNDLQETLEQRKSLVKNVLEKQENQIKLQDEIEGLKILIQMQKKEIIEGKTILLQDQVKLGKNHNENNRESNEETFFIQEKISNCDRETLLMNEKYEKTIHEKTKFKDELIKKVAFLKEEKSKLIKENQTLNERLNQPKNNEKTNKHSEWINQDSKAYINFHEEIDEIKVQIEEFKDLQRSCINERCSLLEPFSQLTKAYELKRLDQIENELSRISQDFFIIFQQKEEKLVRTSEKISKVLKFFTSQLKEKTLEKSEEVKNQSKTLVNSYKDLLNECKNTELLIKSLEIRDKRLDLFKKENNLENCS